MSFDQAGYTYIDTEEGPYRCGQIGGATTAAIDAGFEDPGLRNPLVWKTKFSETGDQISQWEPEHDNWYDLLDITPDYLVEKCKNVSPEMEELIRSPLRRDAYDVRPDRAPGKHEMLGERRYDPDLSRDQRAPIEAYDAEVNRRAEQRAYQGCKLKLPDDPQRINNKIQNRCANYMCRDSHISIGPDGVPVQDVRRADSPDDLPQILDGPLPDKEKAIYQYCADKGLYCTTPVDEEVSTVSKKPFVHVSNAGSGECLFIALAQYLKFVRALGDVYPDYHNNTVPVEHYSRLYPWKPSSHLSYEAGNIWRQRALDWLEAHPDAYITGGAEPGTVSEMMALSLLAYLDLGDVRLVLGAINTTIKDLYNTFIKQQPEHATTLGLTAIKREADISRHIQAAHNAITDRDELAVENPATVPAVSALVEYFSKYYIKAMRSPDSYAGQIEVFALSKVLQADIHVWARTIETNKYKRLLYMSHNSKPIGEPYRTINLLLTQKMNQFGAMSGLKHFEIVFPWKADAPINKPITLFNQFLAAYPSVKTLTPDAMARSELVDPNEVDILLQTLIDMSIQPMTRGLKYFYDRLIDLEAKAVAAEMRKGIAHPNYKEGMYLNQFLTGTILMYIDHIDLPIILNGLFRMIVRNVEHGGDADDRRSNADGLRSDSDKRLRLAVRGLILDIFDYKLPGKAPEGVSIYNQMLADAIIGLKIPSYEISDCVKANIQTLINYLETASSDIEQSPVINTLRRELVIQFAKLISDMYYYSDFRSFFGPSLFPGSKDMQIVRLLKTLEHMTNNMNFDGPVVISETAAAQGYYYGVQQVQQSQQGQQEQESEFELIHHLLQIWLGSAYDRQYIMKKYRDYSQKGYKLPVKEIIAQLTMLEMPHTRQNFNIILEGLEYE